MYSWLRLVFLIGFATAHESERESLCSICECKKKLLDCNYRNLSSLPSLKNASNFTTVSFAYNLLTQVSQFPKSSIRLLSFGNNEIVRITDSAFANLAQLAVLDLSHNSLTTETLLPNVFRVSHSIVLIIQIRLIEQLSK